MTPVMTTRISYVPLLKGFTISLISTGAGDQTLSTWAFEDTSTAMIMAVSGGFKDKTGWTNLLLYWWGQV